ncbi:MAG TPA: hypothetical protein VFQ53_33285 [Kofleriaceae bacterium]|nr:hypothetical protein [Kofleriaceae bacterium]
MTIRLSMLALGVLAVGCGDDPVSYSDTVGINLKAKSAETVGGTVTDDKAITTESGNPYGAFVADATSAIGRDPGDIEVERVELLLGGSSIGVTTLGEVFTGTVEVLFQMNDTNNSYPVASLDVPATTGGGPIALGVSFDGEAVSDVDYTKLLSGSFKVILRGPAASGFDTKGADVDLQTTFTFSAFE